MSKITPKNLSYNNTLPPFLQRLQANNSSANGRHEFTISRPSKLRDEDEEKESEPVVFDEVSGETLSKGEWERREKEREEEGEGKDGEGGVEGEEKGKETFVNAKIAGVGIGSGIGMGKKRKVGKIIGGSEDEGEDEERADSNSANKKASGKQKTEESTKTAAGEKKKPKVATKKGKKIKLSFGDDE